MAKVYGLRKSGAVELVAEVIGEWSLVELVANRSGLLLARTDGRAQLVELLRANGCRVST